MTSIITGDIINSRHLANPEEWLVPLKNLFAQEGKSPELWDIYRGDSFQLEIRQPEKALFTAIRIKTIIKSIKDIDVRMSIGIGLKTYSAPRIMESNGEVFVYAHEQLERLKKEKGTMAVKTPWEEFDREMNLYIRLSLIAMDSWKPKTAQLVNLLLLNPDKGQQQIAEFLGIKQSAVSQGRKRAHLSEIMEMESLFREKIKKLEA